MPCPCPLTPVPADTGNNGALPLRGATVAEPDCPPNLPLPPGMLGVGMGSGIAPFCSTDLPLIDGTLVAVDGL